MKKTLLAITLCCSPTLVLAAQTPVTQIDKFNSAATKIDDVRIAANIRFAASQDNFTQIWEALNGSPWLAQTTAPSIHNVFWIDTAGSPPTIKYWDGDSWEVAAAGGDGTYTLPTASAETKGGVKIGARLTMTGDVLSADAQTTDISGKQDTLVSGTNIKTINGTSVLGLGNIVIDGGSISLATEQNWTAVQNFNAGLTATGLTQNFSSWADWTFGGVQIVNDSGTGANNLWTASKVISALAGKQDVGGGAGGYVSMSAAPYSDTACTTGQYSYYGSTAYLCTGGFWASKWTLTSHSNLTPDIPVITSATIPAPGNVVNVVFDQSMTDGAALGTWTVDCSTTGLASVTTPTGTGVNRAYPIDTSVIKLGETCLGYYTVPAGNDGITATDDSVDLPSQVGFAIDNQSAVPVGNSALFTAATAVWDFDGNSNDTKGVYNLTPNGTITYSTSEKLQGTSSATMGATSYLTYPSDGAFDPGVTGDWSYSAKVKDSNYYSCPLWFRYYSGNGIRDIGTINSTTDKFYFRQYASSVGSTVTGATLTDNTWATITITYKHADAKLYVWISSSTFGDITNGAAYDVTNGAGDATGMLYIGSQGSTTGLITGQLDEVVWWKGYSVTATDAQNIFNGTWR